MPKAKRKDKKNNSNNNFDKSVINDVINTIKKFKDLSELNNLEEFNKPHFADYGGYAYQIAYQFSKYGKEITTNQLRKFYSEIKLIEREGDWEKANLKFNLLKPMFAIASTRKANGKFLIPREFYDLIKIIIDKVVVKDNPDLSFENLKLFSQFFESIVAYHKLHNNNFEIEKDIRKNNKSKNLKIGFKDILNEIKNNDSSKFDYNSFEEICDEINGFSNLQELDEVKFNGHSFEDEEGYADFIGYQFYKIEDKRINPNQLRRFYGEIKNIERKGNWEESKTDFYLLKPRLSSSVARKSGGSTLIPYEFYYLMKITMDKVVVKDNPDLSFENLKLFTRFFESIVAFHKFYSLE